MNHHILSKGRKQISSEEASFFGILNVDDHKHFWLLFVIDLHCWVCYCLDFCSLKLELKGKKKLELEYLQQELAESQTVIMEQGGGGGIKSVQ